jgi:hypothetical protein
MVEMIKDDKLFIYFFYESLSGDVLFWYISLDGNKIRQWTNLIESFMLWYKFNMEVALNRFNL